MYLIKADKDRRYGYKQPRSYINLTAENYSTMNNTCSGYVYEGTFIKTDFTKVRVIQEGSNFKIDCADFRFAKTDGGSLVVRGSGGTRWTFFDVSAYGHA
jgi:hypothetical protein